jgi:hypothetical protein
MREESKKAKQKKTKDFLRAHVLERFCAYTYVRRLSESSHHHHHKSQKHHDGKPFALDATWFE